MELLTNFGLLFLLSAPWLLLGLFIAGLINAYLPKQFLQKHLGKEGFVTTVKAALIGAPMPLCSCGVIPAALGLRRAGASKSATTAFLVSTPETGVDSISVSYVLLGPFMAVVRPVAAICSAIVAGVLVGRESITQEGNKERLTNENSSSEPCCHSKPAPEPVKTSCCASEPLPKSKPIVKSELEPVKETCCATKQQKLPENKTPELNHWNKFSQAVVYSSTSLLADTAKWLLVGLFFAALVQTFVPPGFFLQWGSGILAMVVIILVSIPMYICATASTPIAAGLLLSGVSPGAVLVFMLAGPATNVATLGIVANELGKRAVAAYLVGVIGVAVLFGLLTDYLIANYQIEVVPRLGEHHEVLPQWITYITSFILFSLLLRLVLVHFTQAKQAHA